MSSPARPSPYRDQYGVMFWLPPGGHDNGVFAVCWAELADLQDGDTTPVLDLLARADVGGYVATPGGCRLRRDRDQCHRLWVDSTQFHRAEEVLMNYLRRRSKSSDGPVAEED